MGLRKDMGGDVVGSEWDLGLLQGPDVGDYTGEELHCPGGVVGYI